MLFRICYTIWSVFGVCCNKMNSWDFDFFAAFFFSTLNNRQIVGYLHLPSWYLNLSSCTQPACMLRNVAEGLRYFYTNTICHVPSAFFTDIKHNLFPSCLHFKPLAKSLTQRNNHFNGKVILNTMDHQKYERLLGQKSGQE